MFSGSVCVCAWAYSLHKGVEAWVASQGQPGSQALHLAACQETLQSWKNVWTLPSLWFKGCPGFCLGCCDTIYTGSCPAGAEWAEKHQQIFNPRAQEKRKRSGSRHCWQKFRHGRVFTSFRQCLMIECFLPYLPFPSSILRDTKEFFFLTTLFFWLWPTKDN